MPVVVDPDPLVVDQLLAALPVGSQGVESVERLHAWLRTHTEEYAVVLGPNLSDHEAVSTCEGLRTSTPSLSTVLAREQVDGALLGAAIRAGARDVVHHSDAGAVTSAVGRAHELYAALHGSSAGSRTARVFTVFSPKGGVGKTTIAVNLALALAERGARRVCLVDLDLAFGDVAITMQLFPNHSVEQAVGSEESIDAEMLEGLLTRHQDSLLVLAAPPQPDVLERISPLLVSRILRTLRESFDYVVVDMAPAFDEQSLTALDETDEVVLVATLDVPTLKNVKVALETFDALHIAWDSRHLVLNRADEEVGITADKVEGILGMAVDVRIGSSRDVVAATNAGTPLVHSRPDHQLSRAVHRLAASLTGEGGTTSDDGSDSARGTGLRRLRRRR